MADWNNPTHYPSINKNGFIAKDSEITQNAKDSGRWMKCGDGNWHYNLFWFRTDGESICKHVGAAPPPEPLPGGFESIYGTEPGPNSLKYPYRQAKRTFVDDALPPGVTRAKATEITFAVDPFGLPGARFFRLKRREIPVDGPEAPDSVYCRVVFVHEASQNGTVRYLDFPAIQATDPNQLDDLIAAWQSAIALTDPGSFPKGAIISALLPADERAILEAAQRA